MDNQVVDNNINNQNQQNQEEEKRSFFWAYLLLFTILLFFCVFSITYTYYKGTGDGDDHEITTDQIVFTYSDVDKAGNGINIENAVPISDDRGRIMMGTGEYFDFYITAKSTQSKILYKVLLNKDEASTLADSKVKVYLTAMSGTYEEGVALKKVNELEKEEVDGKDYYVLYEKELVAQSDAYGDSYRLRMWVDESATDYEEQFYSVKVNITAYQVTE